MEDEEAGAETEAGGAAVADVLEDAAAARLGAVAEAAAGEGAAVPAKDGAMAATAVAGEALVSGRNSLNSSRRSGASRKRTVTCE